MEKAVEINWNCGSVPSRETSRYVILRDGEGTFNFGTSPWMCREGKKCGNRNCFIQYIKIEKDVRGNVCFRINISRKIYPFWLRTWSWEQQDKQVFGPNNAADRCIFSKLNWKKKLKSKVNLRKMNKEESDNKFR